jgi:phosphoglycolate phosphatase
MEKLELEKSTFLFDLDGTLINSSRHIVQAVNLTRSDMGLRFISDHHITSKIGLPASQLFEDLSLEAQELNLVINNFRQHLRAISMSAKDVYPGVISLLELLCRLGRKLAVATNKPRSLAIKALHESGILPSFSLVVGADDLPPKPDPGILKECIKSLGSTPKETAMVGDRPEDMMAAVSAGATGIGVTQGFHSKKELLDSGAEIVVKSFSEIERIIRAGV